MRRMARLARGVVDPDLAELPSPFEGTVAALLVEEGQTVEVGTPIITVSSSGDAPAPAAPATPVVEAVADTAATVAAPEKPAAGTSRPRNMPTRLS